MPNLRSQSITSEGIELVASDGRSFSLSRAEAIAVFQAQSGGSRNARLQRAITAITADIASVLGPEQVPQHLIDFDFDDIVGMKQLGVRS